MFIYICDFWDKRDAGTVSWILYYNVPLENDKPGQGNKSGETGLGFFKEPLFYLCTCTLFFYLCAKHGYMINNKMMGDQKEAFWEFLKVRVSHN